MRRSSSFWALVAGFTASVILPAAGGGLALIASLFGLTLRHRPGIVHEVIDGTPVTHA